MELSNEDVERITSLGYSGFYHMENGYKVMNNVGNRCFFLKDGLCSIYKNKPKGCNLYPLVMSLPSRSPAMDLDCPHRHLFRFDPDEIRELSGLIDLLEEERE
jgi:Fe-S-cluster containining protein